MTAKDINNMYRTAICTKYAFIHYNIPTETRAETRTSRF